MILKSLRQVRQSKLLIDSKDILPLCFIGLTAFSLMSFIVFPKGTILIVDVDSVSKGNKLVQHSVTAIVYTNKFGRIQQQQIPQGVIVRKRLLPSSHTHLPEC